MSFQGACMQPADQSVSGITRSNRLGLACGLFLVWLYLALCLWPSLNADFWVLDDHDIATLVGPANRLAVQDIPGLIRTWAFETCGRFRPGYYILRICETWWRGSNPHLWHVDRIILALVTGTALYLTLAVMVGP